MQSAVFPLTTPLPAAHTRGRLAPSPTGFLHLGNAWAFLAAWLGAKAAGGACVLRMEDIDPARSREDYAREIMHDLTWLGLDWEYGPDTGSSALSVVEAAGGAPDVPPSQPEPSLFFQSRRFAVYEAALESLRRRGLAYPCYCTRKELRTIAGAPHVDDAGAPYPGTCRTLADESRAAKEREGRRPAWRLVTDAKTPWAFTDAVMGPQSMTLAASGGDFALRRSDGVFAYQLAVVLDDIAMGVTQIVRGRDILCSTPRQMYLYSLLGAPVPEYAHVPLVLDHEGERLAKRHASLTLRALRESGVLPQTIIGWLAASSGLRPAFTPLTARECLAGFSFAAIRKDDFALPPDPVAYFVALQR